MTNIQPYHFNHDEAQRQALLLNEERMRDISWMYELLGLCQHKHTETHTTGSMWFDGFEVCDDIHEETVCQDCGELIVEEPQAASSVSFSETTEVSFSETTEVSFSEANDLTDNLEF